MTTKKDNSDLVDSILLYRAGVNLFRTAGKFSLAKRISMIIIHIRDTNSRLTFEGAKRLRQGWQKPGLQAEVLWGPR